MVLDDYKQMAETLTDINSKFILSINNHPDIQKVFGEFNIKPVELNYSVGRYKSKKGKELLISNF